MATIFLSPDVYVNEVNRSEIVRQLSSTIFALCGYAKQGDANQVKTFSGTSDAGRFVDHFGTPTPGNPFHYSALAILQSGGILRCARVIDSSALCAGVRAAYTGGHSDSAHALTTGVWPATVAGVAAAVPVVGATPTGAINGSNVAFSFAQYPIVSETLVLTYTEKVTGKVPTEIPNGSIKVFNLGTTVKAGSLSLTIDPTAPGANIEVTDDGHGHLLIAGNPAGSILYTGANAGRMTFDDAPAAGTMSADYFKVAVSITDVGDNTLSDGGAINPTAGSLTLVTVPATGSTLTGSYTKTNPDTISKDTAFYVFAKDPGVWGNNLGIKIKPADPRVTVANGEDIPASQFGDTSSYQFKIEVYLKNSKGNWVFKESWTVSRKTKLDGDARQLNLESRINGNSAYILVANNTAVADTVMPQACGQDTTTPNDTVVTMGGGADSGFDTAEWRANLLGVAADVPIRVTDAVGTNTFAGWQLFADREAVRVNTLVQGGTYGTYATEDVVALQDRLAHIAEARQFCHVIIGFPTSVTDSADPVTAMEDYILNHLTIDSNKVSIYGPAVTIKDALNDQMLRLEPSGYVAGRYAYNDLIASPVDAPAGETRGTLAVNGVTTIFNRGDRDRLYPLGVNPIQQEPGRIYIDGQKTLARNPSALDRVNVRRALNVIEETIMEAVRILKFERNNQVTRYRAYTLCDGYLSTLAGLGWFQTEIDRGFMVRCDEKNNTPNIIDQHILAIDLLVRIAQVAEFIKINTVVTNSSISFEEVLVNGINV